MRPSFLSHQKTWGGCGLGVRVRGPGEWSLVLWGAKCVERAGFSLTLGNRAMCCQAGVPT